jgi:hypothetical protein
MYWLCHIDPHGRTAVHEGGRMKDFQSNDEFFAALRALIHRLCDEHRLVPLGRILPAYLAFNGLADGWNELFNALKATRGLGHQAFTATDWDTLNDLIRAADLVTNRQQNSN